MKFAIFRCLNGERAGNVDFLEEICAPSLSHAEAIAEEMYGPLECEEWHISIEEVTD